MNQSPSKSSAGSTVNALRIMPLSVLAPGTLSKKKAKSKTVINQRYGQKTIQHVCGCANKYENPCSDKSPKPMARLSQLDNVGIHFAAVVHDWRDEGAGDQYHLSRQLRAGGTVEWFDSRYGRCHRRRLVCLQQSGTERASANRWIGDCPHQCARHHERRLFKWFFAVRATGGTCLLP